MDHQLAYQAVHNQKVDLVEAYSTDAKIKEFDLKLLQDDKNYFPSYHAVIMTHLGWVRKKSSSIKKLQELSGTISEEKMIELNSKADIDKKSSTTIARDFQLEIKSESSQKINELWTITLEHLRLVAIPVLIAILIGIPFGYIAYKYPRLHAPLASLTTIFQTIPSLALLTLLIPLTGIGSTSAMIVLFIYALLPILLVALKDLLPLQKLLTSQPILFT